MSDASDKALEAYCRSRWGDGFWKPGIMDTRTDEARGHIDAILSTLTPGTRFTSADGREMVVVPLEALAFAVRYGGIAAEAALAEYDKNGGVSLRAAMIAAASEPDASQASERGE